MKKNVCAYIMKSTNYEATKICLFFCDACKHNKRHVSNLTTGYGTNSEGKKTCFECCGKQDEQALMSLPIGGKYILYLCKGVDGYTVANWPATFWRTATVRKGRHNIARTRYDVWFQVGDAKFHGVQYGEWTQICHVRRIKG